LIGSEIRRKLQTRKVSLEEEESLEMRSFELGVVEFDGNAVVDATEEDVFMSTYGDGFELGGGGHNFEKAFELGTFFE
jgi:hypothetical protein